MRSSLLPLASVRCFAGRPLLFCCLSGCQVGDSLDIEVLRGNEKQHVTAVLDANA